IHRRLTQPATPSPRKVSDFAREGLRAMRLREDPERTRHSLYSAHKADTRQRANEGHLVWVPKHDRDVRGWASGGMLQLWSAGLIKGLLDKVLHVRLADSGEGHSQE